MKRTLLTLLAVLLLLPGCGPAARRAAKVDMGESWLANYIGDQRVGYSVFRVDAFAGGYRFDNLVKMTLAMSGQVQKVQTRAVTETGPDLSLTSFEFSFGSQDRSFSVNGIVEGGDLKLSPVGGGQARTIKLKGPVFPAAALGQLVVARKMSKDSVYKLPVFDVSVLDVIPAEVKVLGRDTITVGGKEYDCTKVQTKLARFEVTTWLDDKGMVVVEQSPPNMRSERTTAAEVLADSGHAATVDVLTMFRVPVDTLIPDSVTVARAKLELSGINAADYDLAGSTQQVVSKEPLVIEITRAAVPAGPVPRPVEGQPEFLAATMSMQCDDPGIKAKALEAVGSETDAVAAARKLVSWVFTVLDKQATASFPTALDVLAHMKGDCNEHAVFYGALARSLGIPAKIAVGLVYLNGAFYYHAWNEVWLGSWVPVDATFGEFPASALHLKLAEGELSKQAEILGVVGNLKIKVLEWQAAAAPAPPQP